MKISPRARLAAALITVVASGLMVPASAMAITSIVVNTTQDGSVPGKTTLRQAIDRANQSQPGDSDEIILAARGNYLLSKCGVAADQSNSTGQLTYFGSGTLTISGGGNTLRQTCPATRVINDISTGLLNINNLTVTGGYAAMAPGGAIWTQASGELDLKNDYFFQNHSDAAGGAVAGQGVVVVTGSTFVSNSANELAGAIASIGPLTLVDSTVTGNTWGADPHSPAPIGGVAASDGLTLLYSTIQDNTAQQVNVEAGGLTSFASVVGLPRAGGVPGQSYPLCAINGGTTSLGYDFSADKSCGFGSARGDRSGGGNPHLRPFAGPMAQLEIVPSQHSPLVDAIPKSRCAPAAARRLAPSWADSLATDEHGVPRPQGKGCDIGALEVPVPTVRLKTSPKRILAGKPVSLTAMAQDVGTSVKSYAWSFGDRSRVAHGRRVTHVFHRRGRYTAKLTVTDAFGDLTTIQFRLTVR